MKIEAVDFFYLSMPEVLNIGDGSQACAWFVLSLGVMLVGVNVKPRHWFRLPAWWRRCHIAPVSRS